MDINYIFYLSLHATIAGCLCVKSPYFKASLIFACESFNMFGFELNSYNFLQVLDVEVIHSSGIFVGLLFSLTLIQIVVFPGWLSRLYRRSFSLHLLFCLNFLIQIILSLIWHP